jgi:ATP-dependent helicase HepA
MVSSPVKPGQRWISETEPELGLGTVLQASEARLKILFPASGELREYAAGQAPLRRVRFRAGDTVKTQDDQTLFIESVREVGGLVVYVGKDRELPEAQLNDRISFCRPEDRLLSGHIDGPEEIHLRRQTLRYQHHRRRSAVRGFVGGRIDLIPHQLSIAHEVSSRHAPRVLLADEVGLGKTIEACLILHRLLLSGRAARVLVLVPETLVHQWFMEMLRKFNLWLHIFDEDRCAAIEAGQPEANPFLDDQLILCSLNFLAGSPRRAPQAAEAGWDVLVVDEAHHLTWSQDRVSPEYALVETLSRRAEGLLLLTATPEQLGPESHFARLRLLDPDRYRDFETFRRESDHYRTIADLTEKLRDGRRLTAKDSRRIEGLFPGEKRRASARLKSVADGDASARKSLLEDLLDLHGPGRVMFRNTRAAISGFPRRRVHLAPLTPLRDRSEWIDRHSTEFASDAGDAGLGGPADLKNDPRIEWLAGLLRKVAPEKVLLICRSPEKVPAIEEALRHKIQVKAGIFHEGLSLVQRDRNAAWFAGEPEVRILLCSEIGSEGRNFQFAHHLVLFDLPLNPELLEQRIGRLDRIGQTQDVHVHVPYLRGSPQEVLSRWYQEGLNAYETSLEGGHELLQRFGRQVHDLALEYPVAAPREAAAELATLLHKTAQARSRLAKRLEQGRDRLLEMNSFRPETARTLIEAIRREDQDAGLEEFMLDVFEHFGVRLEELAPHTYLLNAQGVLTDAFPSIPKEGLIVTFDRQRALGREDVGFLTWDHPMVTGAIDLILGSETGNSGFAVWSGSTDSILLLETVFVLETVAESRWHADRFLPATPLRVVVNHKPSDVTESHPETALEKGLQPGDPYPLLENPALAQTILPAMIQAAQTAAETRAQPIIRDSLARINQLLDHEIHRLKTLQKVNAHVRPQEIELAVNQQKQLARAIAQARVRLDSVRLIWKGPVTER